MDCIEFILSSQNNTICDHFGNVFAKHIAIECICCNFSCDNIINAYNHFNDKHVKTNQLCLPENVVNLDQTLNTNKCDLKLKVQLNETKISEHLNKCDFEQNIVNTKHFVCNNENCGKIFSYRQGLNRHKKLHNNPICCDWLGCNKQFADFDALKYHKLVHSDDRDIRCEWPGCDYTAKTKGNLRMHIRSHTKQKPYHCDWPGCEDTFWQLPRLNIHINKRHVNIYKHKCLFPNCGSKFKTKDDLRLHRKFHKKGTTFTCDWPGCERVFTSKTVLKRHRVTHTGERPYVCDWPGCCAKFGLPGTLGTHKKLVHKCDYIKRSRWDNKKK